MIPVPETFHPTPVFTSRLIQFLLCLFLMVALINRQQDFVLFLLLLLGIAFGAKLWSRMSSAHIRSATTADRRKVFPGEPVAVAIQVENGKWLPVWFRIELPQTLQDPASEQDFAPKESGLLWFQKVSFAWTVNPRKRGVYAIGPPRIAAGDLMGFYPRQIEAKEAIELIVFPRLIPLHTFSFPRRDYFGTPGSKSPVQDPVYILGTRDYQSWRPARYIHWKASSRQNRLQEKIFEPSEQAKVLLVVEVEQFEKELAETAFESTLEVAASLAVQLTRQGYAVGLITDGAVKGNASGMVNVARNSRQLSLILEVLARLTMEKSRTMDDFFPRGSHLPWGLSCARFVYRANPSDRLIETRLRQSHIPWVTFCYEIDSHPDPNAPGSREVFYRIGDIRATGIEAP